MNENQPSTSEDQDFVAPETGKEEIDKGYPVETIGDIEPTQLSPEQFDQQAWLFHAANSADFHVTQDFDYSQEIVDTATLGQGLYTTTDQKVAQNYAALRQAAAVAKLLPFQAKMLNLTEAKEARNASVPKEIVREWVEFARPQIIDRVRQTSDQLQVSRYSDVLGKMAKLVQKDIVDLRRDILDTGNAPFSIVDDLWREFCQVQGWDGVICVEGGEDHFSKNQDRTYIFYNLEKVGTYRDWQERKARQESNELQ